MTNPQRMMFPIGTVTDATFGLTTPPIEATVCCPSQVLEHIPQSSLSSFAKLSHQPFFLSNPLPIPTPHLQFHDGRFVPYPNSSFVLPIHLNALSTQEYVASNGPLRMSPAPVMDTMSHNTLGTRPRQIVTSAADVALLHANSGIVAPGPTVNFCSSSTIESQALMYSFESNPMRHQECNVEETNERLPDLSQRRMLNHTDEKMSIQDKSSIQYNTDTPLNLSKKTTESLDTGTSCVTNETISALADSTLRSTSHAGSSSVANYEYFTRKEISVIARCVAKIVAASRMAKSRDTMAHSSSKVHERGNGMVTNKTFTPQEKTCPIREAVKLFPREAEMQGQLFAGEGKTMDLNRTDRNTSFGIQSTQFSRHDQNKRNDKNLLRRKMEDELPSFFNSSRKPPPQRSEFGLIKLADPTSNAKQRSLEFEEILTEDNIDHQTEQSVNGSKSRVTFDLEQEEEAKVTGCPDGKNRQSKGCVESVNRDILSYGEILEKDGGKDKRHKVESANIGTGMVEKKSSYYYMTPRNFNRKIKERKSVKRLQKTKTEEKPMKTDRYNISVRNMSIPLRDVSKLLSSSRSGSQDEMERNDQVANLDQETSYPKNLNDTIKPFSQRVVLKKDDKNKWTVIRSVGRKRNATAMFGPPSNGKSKRLTTNLKDNEGNSTFVDDRSSFEKGDNKGVNEVHLRMKSPKTKGEGPPNSSTSETLIVVNIDSDSSHSPTPEENLEGNRPKGKSSACAKGVQKPTNYSHLSAKERVRFLRTRMRTSEEEVANFLKNY